MAIVYREKSSNWFQIRLFLTLTHTVGHFWDKGYTTISYRGGPAVNSHPRVWGGCCVLGSHSQSECLWCARDPIATWATHGGRPSLLSRTSHSDEKDGQLKGQGFWSWEAQTEEKIEPSLGRAWGCWRKELELNLRKHTGVDQLTRRKVREWTTDGGSSMC